LIELQSGTIAGTTRGLEGFMPAARGFCDFLQGMGDSVNLVPAGLGDRTGGRFFHTHEEKNLFWDQHFLAQD
jgi:hypothetical protein